MKEVRYLMSLMETLIHGEWSWFRYFDTDDEVVVIIGDKDDDETCCSVITCDEAIANFLVKAANTIRERNYRECKKITKELKTLLDDYEKIPNNLKGLWDITGGPSYCGGGRDILVCVKNREHNYVGYMNHYSGNLYKDNCEHSCKDTTGKCLKCRDASFISASQLAAAQFVAEVGSFFYNLSKGIRPTYIFDELQNYNVHMYNVLCSIADLYLKKNKDYAKDGPYSGLEKVAQLSNTTVDEVIKMFINTKISRLESLSGREANNESVQDTLMDLANYILILKSWENRK